MKLQEGKTYKLSGKYTTHSVIVTILKIDGDDVKIKIPNGTTRTVDILDIQNLKCEELLNN